MQLDLHKKDLHWCLAFKLPQWTSSLCTLVTWIWRLVTLRLSKCQSPTINTIPFKYKDHYYNLFFLKYSLISPSSEHFVAQNSCAFAIFSRCCCHCHFTKRFVKHIGHTHLQNNNILHWSDTKYLNTISFTPKKSKIS